MRMNIAVGVAVLFASNALLASADARSECFNFDSPVTAPLKKPIGAVKKSKDATASGQLDKTKGLWGAVRGDVNRPIKEIYAQLLDHYTIKDASRVKLQVYEQERKGYQDFHVVMLKLHAAPMVDVAWEEEWGYVITDGTPADPKQIVISYQKTNGTEYIPHLCGSIVLNSQGPGKTDVYLYEEIEALGKRSAKDTVLGHLGTLKTLRDPKGRAVASQKDSTGT